MSEFSSSSIMELFPHNSTPSFSFLLSHLRNVENPNLIQYLANFLFKFDLSEVQLYIPQVLNIYLVLGDENIERFLLEACLRDWMFGMEVYWKCCSMAGGVMSISNTNSSNTTNSNGSQISNLNLNGIINPNSMIAKNRMKYLAKEVEKVLVEKKLPKKFQSISINEKQENGILDQYYLNAFSSRLCSFHDMIYFVDFLIDLTKRLLIYPLGPMRNARLRLELRQFLNDGGIPHGVFWPLGSTNDPYERIVNICVDDCFALSTKERVPCLIYMEVLRDPKSKNSHPPHISILETTKHRSSSFKSNLHKSMSESILSSSGTEESNNNNLNVQVHTRSISLDQWELEDDKPISPLNRSHHISELEEESIKIPNSNDEGFDSDEEFIIVDVPDTKEMLLHSVFGESWEVRKQRLREQSPFGHYTHWDIRSFIVKSNSDIRQEEFCMQLIRLFKQVWMEAKIPVNVCDYSIYSTNGTSGLIETIRDAVSYDGLIKNFVGYTSLLDYFIAVYGNVNSTSFMRAQANFTESLAAYSVICYLLQIKDRHNGNIMIDREGNIIHIDFGFFLGSSPGLFQFENVPFKLTKSFVEVIAGTKENPEKSTMFTSHFRIIFEYCYRTAIQQKDKFLNLIKSMLPSALSFPCFEKIKDGNEIIKKFEERFHPEMNDDELKQFFNKLIDDSYMAQRTWAYDWYQNQTNGLRFEQ